MSREKKWPDFDTSVDVTIYADELEDAGWRYVGNDDSADMDPQDVLDVIEHFHNDVHPGAYRFCDASPCRELRAV